MKRWISLLCVLLSAAVCRAQEEFSEPGWFLAVGHEASRLPPGFTFEEEEEGVGAASAGDPIAEAITPEIEALARGLENDPKRIFDYVHDHIRYVHYFGSKKGAQLTLLEKSGNDFDQCALLVSLLRAAGHTADYRFGLVAMSYGNFKTWLGLTKPATNLTEALDFGVTLNDYRGFPLSDKIEEYGYLAFHRVWVRYSSSNTVYSLDPAFKDHEPIPGINLSNAMALDVSQLLSAAGGTTNVNYVENLSESNLRNKLRDYTTNLLHHLQTGLANAPVDYVMGGQHINTSVGDPLNQALPFVPVETMDWGNLPTNFMTTLTVSVDGTNRFFYMPELQGRRLALTFTTNGVGQLRLEDELVLEKATSGGATVNVALKVDHPHGRWNSTNSTLINTNWNDHSVTAPYQRTNASYAITYAFDPHPDWLRQRQEKLDRYRKQGLADTSREVETETLNVMGLNWMLQTEKIAHVVAAQQEMLVQRHHRLGRMAQEAGQGYYIDVYQQLSGDFPASGKSTNDFARADRLFDVRNYFVSAAEHGLIEQLQATNLAAASTIKMLQIANTNGQRIYQARSANWSSIQGSLSHYDNNFIKTNYIDKGYTLLMPANGSNSIAGTGSWAGYGIVALKSTPTDRHIEMVISGGYHGAYATYPDSSMDPVFITYYGYSQPLYFDAAPPLVGSPMTWDPVAMADGSLRLESTDLSAGQREPRGITFTRYYSSSRRHHDLAGMAHGWIHNYHIRAADISAPMAALGDTTPQQMAAFVVAARSAVELYDPAGSPKNWAVTALIAKWGVDQLINNAVSVTLGDGTLQFIKQPDGSFTPPAKSTMTLLKTNGVYWLKERHGNTFKFNAAGLLTNIVDQYNQSLTVSYNASNRVDKVKDWKNREFTFNYTGTPSRLTSVTDGARTVSFGYTTASGQTDLTSFTDAENKTSAYLYDTNHQMTATKDALNRVVVTNFYDDFGRVIEQHNQGDTNKIWRYYWSGYRNVEEDPAGGRKRYFFDDKRRLITLQDAAGNYTDWFYDGQDHVETIIYNLDEPTEEITDFYFDGRHNVIYTQDPRGEWRDFFYDSQDRLVRIRDERLKNSYFGYNAQHSLTGSTNNAGDWVNYTYNADGTPATRVDPGGTAAYSYDSWGQLRAVTHPASLGGEGFLNSSFGDVLSRTNARGFVTGFQYNARRQLTNTVAPTNLTARVSFDAAANVETTTDARGFSATNRWSATQKLLSTTLPATPQGSPMVTNIYDSRDWLARTIDPLQAAVNYTNDAAGRVVAVTDPLQRTTRFGYDQVGRRTATTNAAIEVTRQTWSKRGEPLQSTDPASRIVRRGYDAAGNQITLTNRNGKKWQFQYDAANRLTNTITPLGRETRATYNNRGLVSAVREPSTQTTTNLYDPKGRLTNAVDQVASRVFRYDANNNVTNIVEAGKSNVWTFDAYDRVSTYKDADGNEIKYSHDANGNLTQLIYPGGKTVTYAYDSLNRLTNVTDWASRQTTFTYDLASRLRVIERPNGTVREINYDAAGQITNIVERLTNNAPIAFFKLNWNNAGRVEWEFAAPLPQPHTPPTRVMTFDDDNRLLTFNGQTVTNDADGNLTYGPLTTNTLVNYTYDARNRLVGTAVPSGPTVTYGYDPAGNRTSITNGADVTRHVINPNAALSQVLIRTRPDGSKTFYVYGVGLLYEVNETSGGTETSTRFYHYDYRGSTVALTDGGGIPTDYAQYSVYGTVTYRLGTNDTPFLFNGRYGVQTDSNGLLYMRARYYNPHLCRFLNADPIGFEGGLNFYAYADGNPISLIDPFGLGSANESMGNTWLSGVGGFAADAMFNADLLKQSWHELRNPDWSTALGWTTAGVATVGLVAGTVDAVANVATLGGKGVVTGGIKKIGRTAVDFVSNLFSHGGAKTVGAPPNRIYSARELVRRAEEPGPFHNFPESFNQQIFEQGTRTVTPNFYNVARSGLGNDAVMYRLPGNVNGTSGMFEIGVRPSVSGNTEVIMHRFFNPDP